MENELIVATDGSSKPNPGVGGYAFIIEHRTKRYQGWGSEDSTTNNRQELMGAISALRFIREHDLFSGYDSIRIISDSQYTVDGFNKWMDGWNAREWHTTQRAPVKNADLWRILESFKTIYPIIFTWIKGHNEHPLNELCDQMATDARNKKI